MRAERRWTDRLSWWDGRGGLLLLDIVVAGAVVGLEFESLRRITVPTAVYVLAVCATGLSLLVRRRYPFAGLIVVSASVLAGVSLIPLMIALYSVAARHGLSLVTGAAALIGTAAGLVPQLSEQSFELGWGLAAFSALVVAPMLGGLWMYQRAALLKALRERAEEAERNRTLLADQAVSAERRRIAREMHDVVAHRVTAIALQAGALTLNPPDERTGKIGENIRAMSSGALDELRGILNVLRHSDESTLSDVANPDAIGKLVAESGAEVNLSQPDPWPAVPDDVSRAAYRVIQESLTNAGKHAPGVRVDVTVAATGSTLVVTVTNPLTTTSAGMPRSGYGLLGMRERVELAGGQVHTGPRDGRFEVVATFPLVRSEARQ